MAAHPWVEGHLLGSVPRPPAAREEAGLPSDRKVVSSCSVCGIIEGPGALPVPLRQRLSISPL